jgi:hypothetical protein
MIQQPTIPRFINRLCREDALARLSLYGIKGKRVYLIDLIPHELQIEKCVKERGLYLDIMESFATYYYGAKNLSNN